jgi:hypothetical protein
VLTPEELSALKGALGTIATVAYDYSQGLRQALALANVANEAASAVLGLLPVG